MKKLFGLALVLGFFLNACSPPEENQEITPVVGVKVARVREVDLDILVKAPALVYPLEQANLAARLTARIQSLSARKGDRVEAGQVLARLEDRDLLANREEALAGVADAAATLEKMSEGTVQVGLERALGQVAASQATLGQAQADLDRRRGLFEQGAIPEKDLISSRTALATAQASADVAAAELRLLQNQTSTSDIEIAQSRLDQARSRLALSETHLDFATIRSPFAGVVTEQFLFPGDMAGPGTPLFTVANLSVAVARAQVPEVEARELHPGQLCTLFPADQPETSFGGQVSIVNSAVDRARRTVEVWCEIPNPGRELRSGAFGSVSIRTSTLSRALVVPLAAVQFEEGSTRGIVVVVNEEKTVEHREVETGVTSEGRVPIKSGLAAGEIVIIEGGYGLAQGTRVEWTGALQ